jgi:hypothetical protein
MSHSRQLIIIVFFVLGLAACQDSSSDEAQAGTESSLSMVAKFDRDMSKRGCELLSAELVSATLDVPADTLTQRKIMGCRYDWKNDTQTLNAALSMIRAHDSEAVAAQWFANATSNRTAEQMAAEMGKISGQLDQQEQLDTAVKKSTAKNLLAMVETKAVNFEDVAGVGDEARISDEGTLFVRVDNLTFMVSAYRGADAPKPDLSGLGADIKQIAARVNESNARWISETLPQRKADATRLAKGIIAEL